jgi:hypothetical protein
MAAPEPRKPHPLAEDDGTAVAGAGDAAGGAGTAGESGYGEEIVQVSCTAGSERSTHSLSLQTLMKIVKWFLNQRLAWMWCRPSRLWD